MELASIEDPQAKWAKTVEVAELAESLGYDSLWVYDHFHNVPVPAHEAMFECWTTLAAISQRTERIMLGQMVGCSPYRNPGLLAKITSNLDVISGGRLIWGVGAGLVRERVHRVRLRLPLCRRADPGPARDRRDRDGHVVRARRELRGPSLHPRGRPVRPEAAAAASTPGPRSVAAASSSRCGWSPGWPTPPTSAASLTNSTTSATSCARTAGTWAVTTTRSRRRGRRRSSSGRTSRRSSTAAPARSSASRSTRGATATWSAPPSRWPRRSWPTSTLGCTGFYPWCSDYPDTDEPAPVRRAGHARGPPPGRLKGGLDPAGNRHQVGTGGVAIDLVGVRVDRRHRMAAVPQLLVDDVRAVVLGMPSHAVHRDPFVGQEL